MSSLCILCKGAKALCGNRDCPILQKEHVMKEFSDRFRGKDFFGSSPSLFVGRYNYPNVYVGPMVTDIEESWMLDTPSKWFGMGADQIVAMRSELFRCKLRTNVREASRVVSDLQDVALSVKPVDTEISLYKKPNFNVRFDAVNAPLGPSGQIRRFDLTENPHIPRSVYSVIGDELKAVESMNVLYDKGIEVSSISRILSSGALGQDRRMVPTRWSITAVDSSLSDKLVKEIKDYPLTNDYLLFSSEFLGNHFELLLLPQRWSFEQLEVYLPGGLWTKKESKYHIIQDWEGNKGRKKYASQVQGAYYAARLAVGEYLSKVRRQASCIVFREIKPTYVIPVGVWQIRENCRNAFGQEPAKFDTLESALFELDLRTEVPLKAYKNESELLKRSASRAVLEKYLTR